MVSGGGTTMAAILEAIRKGELDGVRPALVIASKPGIGAISKARLAGIGSNDIVVISPKAYPDKALFARRIIEECRARKVNFIGQYGWLPKTPLEVIRAFPGMMVNQHPGPLDPSIPGYDFGGEGMYGTRVTAARLHFVRMVNRDFWTEATAQRVEPEFDRGVVLKARRVPILPEDTVETLQARLLPAEHRVQIDTLRDFTQGKVSPVCRSAGWLVKNRERATLAEAKSIAIAQYPHG